VLPLFVENYKIEAENSYKTFVLGTQSSAPKSKMRQNVNRYRQFRKTKRFKIDLTIIIVTDEKV
jgi:hypothetical protein